ncbi:MAG: hypothetical protein ACK444_04300 [Flavobacteriales bacterium]|jgi:uncharacterized membrane protein
MTNSARLFLLVILTVCVHSCTENNTGYINPTNKNIDSNTTEKITPEVSTQEELSVPPQNDVQKTRPTNANELLKLITNNSEIVEFHGQGTEPFWDLYLTKDEVLYTVNEEKTSYILLTPFNEFAKEQIIKYKDENGEIFKVTIRKERASDGMSDEDYPYSVIFSETELWKNGGGYSK